MTTALCRLTHHQIATGILAMVLLSPAMAVAEARIAFVNTAQILEQAPQAVTARDRLQQEFSPREAEIVAQQKQLKALEDRLSRDGAVMSEEARRKIEREVVAQQREVKRARDEFTEDLNIRRSEEFARLQKTVADAVMDLAKQGQYDLILENGVVYASPTVDITDRVLDKLKQSAPPPAAKP